MQIGNIPRSKVSTIKVIKLPQVTSVLKKVVFWIIYTFSEESLGRHDFTKIIDP